MKRFATFVPLCVALASPVAPPLPSTPPPPYAPPITEFSRYPVLTFSSSTPYSVNYDASHAFDRTSDYFLSDMRDAYISYQFSIEPQDVEHVLLRTGNMYLSQINELGLSIGIGNRLPSNFSDAVEHFGQSCIGTPSDRLTQWPNGWGTLQVGLTIPCTTRVRGTHLTLIGSNLRINDLFALRPTFSWISQDIVQTNTPFESIALSGDGMVVAVGRPNDAEVTLHTREQNGWTRVSISEPIRPSFGTRVALNQDGTRLVVGAPYEADDGRVHLYTRTTSSWSLNHTFTSPYVYGQFGIAVGFARNASFLAVGAPNASAVRVYEDTDSGWAQLGPDLIDVEGFGASVALAARNGELRVVVGHPSYLGGGDANERRGRIMLYAWNGSEWNYETGASGQNVQSLMGTQVDISADASFIGGSMVYPARVSMKGLNDRLDNWQPFEFRDDSQQGFGSSFALSGDARRVVIGCDNGTVNLYDLNESGDSMAVGDSLTNVVASAVAIDEYGETVVVGSKTDGTLMSFEKKVLVGGGGARRGGGGPPAPAPHHPCRRTRRHTRRRPCHHSHHPCRHTRRRTRRRPCRHTRPPCCYPYHQNHPRHCHPRHPFLRFHLPFHPHCRHPHQPSSRRRRHLRRLPLRYSLPINPFSLPRHHSR